MRRILVFACLLIWTLPSTAQNRVLADCRSIEDVFERVSCYDAIVDAAQLSVPVEAIQPSPAAEPAQSSPAAEPARPSPAAEPAQPAPVLEREVSQPQPANTASSRQVQQEQDFGREIERARDEPESIQSAVRAVSSSAFGKIVVELENGHTWQQVDSNRLRIREGDQVEIRSGRMGAYFLEKTEGSREIRVRRVL